MSRQNITVMKHSTQHCATCLSLSGILSHDLPVLPPRARNLVVSAHVYYGSGAIKRDWAEHRAQP